MHSTYPDLAPGVPYAGDIAKFPDPLTPAAPKSGWKLPGLDGTIDTAGKLNKLPVGGSLGLVGAALLIWATPVELMSGLGVLAIFLGIVGGMATQRLLRWLFGWYAEPAIERAEKPARGRPQDRAGAVLPAGGHSRGARGKAVHPPDRAGGLVRRGQAEGPARSL
jgi:hypothetical protein